MQHTDRPTQVAPAHPNARKVPRCFQPARWHRLGNCGLLKKALCDVDDVIMIYGGLHFCEVW